MIFQQATLAVGYDGAPRLGGNVLVGSGGKLLGEIRIGANAVVLHDVPVGATAGGVPARLMAAGPALLRQADGRCQLASVGA